MRAASRSTRASTPFSDPRIHGVPGVPCCRWAVSISANFRKIVSASCRCMPSSATVRAAPRRTFGCFFSPSSSSSVAIAFPVSAGGISEDFWADYATGRADRNLK